MIGRFFLATTLLVSPALAGQNDLFVRQIGEQQIGTVLQKGASNRAYLFQGVDDPSQLGMALDQIGRSDQRDLLGQIGPNLSVANRADLVQRGFGNQAVAVQHGSANMMQTHQTGHANTAVHAQIGNGNESSLIEIGNNNDASLRLVGDNNRYAMTVRGSNLRGIEVSVNGSNVDGTVGGGLVISNRR